jgi:hypothetical protein
VAALATINCGACPDAIDVTRELWDWEDAECHAVQLEAETRP